MKINKKHLLTTKPEYQTRLYNKVTGSDGRDYFYNGDPNGVLVIGSLEDKASSRTDAYEMLLDEEDFSTTTTYPTTAQELLDQTGVDLSYNHFSMAFVVTKAEAEAFTQGSDIIPLLGVKSWAIGSRNQALDKLMTIISNNKNIDTADLAIVSFDNTEMSIKEL